MDAERLQHGHGTAADAIGGQDLLDTSGEVEAEPEPEPVDLVVSSHQSHHSISPATQLPVEVLACIFDALRVLEPSKTLPLVHYLPATRYSPSYIMGWMKVAHVCGRWRDAALAFACLWSDINFNLSPEWRDEILCRSRMAPIRMDLYRNDFNRPEIRDILSQHLNHTRQLTLRADIQRLTPIIPSLSCEAPLLEQASLSTEMDFGIGPSLPRDLFGQHAPRLRHLVLQHLTIMWPSLNFNILTYLEINQCSTLLNVPAPLVNTNSEAPSNDYAEFLGAIQRLPTLEILVLKHAMPSLPPTATLETPYGSVTCLSRLQKLVLTDDVLACALFLRYVNMPSTAQQQIHCDLDAGRPIDLIFPWLKSKVSASSGIRRLSFLDQLAGIHLLGWDESFHNIDTSFLGDDPTTSPLFDLTITLSGSGSTRLFAPSICGVLPLEDLEELSIHTYEDNWDVQHWFDAFHGLNNVTQVQVGLPACASSFCDAFSMVNVSHNQDEDGPVADQQGVEPLFPSLDTLMLVEVPLWDNNCFFSAELPMLLEDRNTFREFNTLILVACDPGGETLAVLRSVVPEVLWDEDPGGGSMSDTIDGSDGSGSDGGSSDDDDG
ncbi:hypothetical protein EVG20_g9065 [Dentipellis fragilis]|uniref:Uncharacterized protein n=1 Tax=Dentipellis fragilis TaxID=205917 RepID=A0A4Y9Y2E5_9AGAM|nr:hypothetical protein EVG20_g9065 [Dentipellis fragilis]